MALSPLDTVSYDIVSIEFPNACVLGSRGGDVCVIVPVRSKTDNYRRYIDVSKVAVVKFVAGYG